MRRPCCTLAAVALLLSAGVSAAGDAAPGDAAPEAQRLSKAAAERWQKATLEERHKAIEALEQAAKLAPRDLKLKSQLAHAYLDAGYNHDAKELFEHITEMAPDSSDAWDGLGRVWKRDWLATLARPSLDKAIGYLEQAVRLDPTRAQAWTTLAVLRVQKGDLRGAGLAAGSAQAAAPESTEATLASAYLEYRIGHLADAESLFTIAIARLPRSLALRFRDITPLLPPQDGEELQSLSPAEHAERVRRFWSASDPDPTTRVNEARLEYWARIAHATLLFSDSWEPAWDMRAELYVRYGPPDAMAYQPPGIPIEQTPNLYPQFKEDRDGLNGTRRIGEALSMSYSEHAQVWFYPKLGMAPLLEDRSISQHYELPRRAYADGEWDAMPNPVALAHSGLLATGGGRGVFAPLPPGEHPLPVEAEVSAFQGDKGPRLLANVATPGAPGRVLHAECVVLDSTEREVARMARELGASRCDAATTRAGDFAFDLPPGRYRVAVSVRDEDGGRGVVREPHALAALPGALAVSDIVLVCGPLETLPVGGSVRLDPNLERRIGGSEPLLAYFEVYALRADVTGATKFEYDYKVHALARDTRPWFKRMFSRSDLEPISVHSPEEGAGPTRRQYLSVPTQSLLPGRYRLEVTVKDHGATARREVEFEKVSGTAEDAVGAR